MKKNNYFVGLIIFGLSFFGFFNSNALAETATDTFSITVNGSALNTTNALNITVGFNGGTAQVDSGVSFKGTGATQLLTDVNSTTGLITVVWTGNITDGKATITGKIKAGSKTGNPVMEIKKVEAAGGKDITSQVTSSATITTPQLTASPTPTPIASPTPTTSPTPTASPMPTATSTPTPGQEVASLTLTGPETYTLKKDRLNFFKVLVTGSNFNKTSKCTVSTSDDSLAKPRPVKFLLSSARNKKVVILRVPSLSVSEFVDQGLEDILTVSVSCSNGAEADTDVIITSGVNTGQ